MIYVADPDACIAVWGHTVGRGQCVDFVRHVAQCPPTKDWRRGALVRGQGDTLMPGTVIATFHPDTERYENDTSGRSHAAVFLSEKDGGLKVMDQWVGHPVAVRLIRYQGGDQPHVDDGDAYYVLETHA